MVMGRHELVLPFSHCSLVSLFCYNCTQHQLPAQMSINAEYCVDPDLTWNRSDVLSYHTNVGCTGVECGGFSFVLTKRTSIDYMY